jgi:hypothetical protein
MVFLSMASFSEPFNGPLGRYTEQAQHSVVGKTVWVPYNFNAKFEIYRFLLPSAIIRAYREENAVDLNKLAQQYSVFAVRVPLGTQICVGCTLLGQRFDLRDRHSNEELRALLKGKVFENLFQQEMLIQAPEKAK